MQPRINVCCLWHSLKDLHHYILDQWEFSDQSHGQANIKLQDSSLEYIVTWITVAKSGWDRGAVASPGTADKTSSWKHPWSGHWLNNKLNIPNGAIISRVMRVTSMFRKVNLPLWDKVTLKCTNQVVHVHYLQMTHIDISDSYIIKNMRFRQDLLRICFLMDFLVVGLLICAILFISIYLNAMTFFFLRLSFPTTISSSFLMPLQKQRGNSLHLFLGKQKTHMGFNTEGYKFCWKAQDFLTVTMNKW